MLTSPAVTRFPVNRPVANTSSLNDIYGKALLWALAAYAISGKGFAYVGVAPLYVSEVLLLLGIGILYRTGAFLAILTAVPGALMFCLLILVIIKTVRFIPQYGVDAVRDSVIVVYCLFAFIVAGLLLERPSRVGKVVDFLRGLTGIYVYVGPFSYLSNMVSNMHVLPTLPGSPVPMLYLRPGELAVHLCGCTVLAIVRLRSASVLWTITLCAGIAVVASQNRGGFLAILIPAGIALFLTGRWRGIIAPLIGICLAFSLAYAVDLTLPTNRDDGRSVGARQIGDNLISLISPSANKELDDTKVWREKWWEGIIDYTLHGRYFWTGKGFGVNLAQADGFLGVEDGPTLRSPHNSHLTILARTGVPGMILWGLFGFCWMWSVLSCARLAWSLEDEPWGNLLLFTACYWLSIIIDASFDVVLEGPMLGIWFWSLTGFGLAVVMIYRSAVRQNTRTAKRRLAFEQKRMLKDLQTSA